MIDWVGIVVGWAVGGALTWLATDGRRRWQRRRFLRAVTQAPKQDAVALVVQVGGRGDALPDVRSFLEAQADGPRQILSYAAPREVDLADPATALAVVEDLRDGITEYGRGKLREVHLFYAGMTPYPFALGNLLANWCPVVAYALQDGHYVALYRISDSTVHRQARVTRPLARFAVEPVAAATPGPPRLAAEPPAESAVDA